MLVLVIETKSSPSRWNFSSAAAPGAVSTNGGPTRRKSRTAAQPLNSLPPDLLSFVHDPLNRTNDEGGIHRASGYHSRRAGVCRSLTDDRAFRGFVTTAVLCYHQRILAAGVVRVWLEKVDGEGFPDECGLWLMLVSSRRPRAGILQDRAG